MPDRRANDHHAAAPLPDENRPPTPQQLARLAELVADGKAALPRGLPSAQLQELIRQVQRRRRDRLIQFIGRAIARDLRRRGGRT
jgi:hypothetical protein